MRKLRILVLVHKDCVPPAAPAPSVDLARAPWKTEYDVVTALRDLGHEAHAVGVAGDLMVIRKAIEELKPHVAFNLLEEFDGVATFDHHVVSFLELMRLPYSGCNPRGLMLARDKALSKQLLAFHRIPIPGFAVFPVGGKVRRPKRLDFPLFVKSLWEEASLGISRASMVENAEQLTERVAFIHEQIGTDAIVERYIEGRELYVGVLGNQRLRVLPIWELLASKLPEDAPLIATAKLKWDLDYQKKVGVETRAARNLPTGTAEHAARLCKRVYRALRLSGYARIDLRLDPDGRLYVLEANPNPQLAYGEDFAESAHAAGIAYEDLLQRIVNLGLRRRFHGCR